jgi:hypothetical protein
LLHRPIALENKKFAAQHRVGVDYWWGLVPFLKLFSQTKLSVRFFGLISGRTTLTAPVYKEK